jgi:adenylate cyclase class IV
MALQSKANVEVKLKLAGEDEWLKVRAAAADLTKSTGSEICQTDQYYTCANNGGRLKLRTELYPCSSSGYPTNTLIRYSRTDKADIRGSVYELLELSTSQASMLDKMLAAAVGRGTYVHKTRWLYMSGNTRIHFDKIAGLGYFVELEYVCSSKNKAEDGPAVVKALLKTLHLENAIVQSESYEQLLAHSNTT